MAIVAGSKSTNRSEMETTVADTIDILRGIWLYGALDLFTKNGRKTPQEYEARLFKFWDYLDTLPLPDVEGVFVELEGKQLGEHDTIDTIVYKQVRDYHVVRVETGEAEQG